MNINTNMKTIFNPKTSHYRETEPVKDTKFLSVIITSHKTVSHQ